MKPLSEDLKEIEISKYGIVKVKGFSVSDFKYILSIKDIKDSEEFTKKVLAYQIVEPELSFESLNEIEVSDVIKIIKVLSSFLNNAFVDIKLNENVYIDFKEKLLI